MTDKSSSKRGLTVASGESKENPVPKKHMVKVESPFLAHSDDKYPNGTAPFHPQGFFSVLQGSFNAPSNELRGLQYATSGPSWYGDDRGAVMYPPPHFIVGNQMNIFHAKSIDSKEPNQQKFIKAKPSNSPNIVNIDTEDHYAQYPPFSVSDSIYTAKYVNNNMQMHGMSMMPTLPGFMIAPTDPHKLQSMGSGYVTPLGANMMPGAIPLMPVYIPIPAPLRPQIGGNSILGFQNITFKTAGDKPEIVQKKMSRHAHPWDEMYSYVVKYAKEHGHCNVPKRFVAKTLDGSELRIGQWLCDQRKAYRNNCLHPDRKIKIDELMSQNLLRPGYNSKTEISDKRWGLNYQALLEYGNRYKDCNVPREYAMTVTLPDGTCERLNLGNWLHKQRTNRKNGKLSEEKMSLLQKLVQQKKFLWDIRAESEDDRWKSCYDALQDYAKIYGHCNLAQRECVILASGINFRLGLWLKKQKVQNKAGKLRADRKEKLQQLVDKEIMSWEQTFSPISIKSSIESTVESDAQHQSLSVRDIEDDDNENSLDEFQQRNQEPSKVLCSGFEQPQGSCSLFGSGRNEEKTDVHSKNKLPATSELNLSEIPGDDAKGGCTHLIAHTELITEVEVRAKV